MTSAIINWGFAEKLDVDCADPALGERHGRKSKNVLIFFVETLNGRRLEPPMLVPARNKISRGIGQLGTAIIVILGSTELQCCPMAMRLAPGVSNYFSAFAALAQTVFDAVTASCRDHECVRLRSATFAGLNDAQD